MSCCIRQVSPSTYRVLTASSRGFLGSIAQVCGRWSFIPANLVTLEQEELNDIMFYINQIRTGTLVRKEYNLV